MALFDEKYGDEVRVLSVGDFSKELCGGTHVKNSGEIGMFKITSEAGIASGVRRIEAVTGMNTYALFNERDGILQGVAELLKTGRNDVITKITSTLAEIKAAHKEIEDIRKANSLGYVEVLLKNIENVNGISLVKGEVKDVDMAGLRDLTEKVLDKLQSGVVVLGAEHEGKVNFSVMISKDLVKKGLHAGKMIKEIASIAGGGGGGRPDMAQAGGKNAEKLNEAINIVNSLLTV